MKLDRKQRINQIANQMVTALNNVATECRQYLSKGIDSPAQNGEAAIKATAEEVRDALSENLKNVEIAVSFILDGKSNKITKGKKKS